MSDPMSEGELGEIRARLDRALADENSLAGAELTDIIALLAEIDRLRASRELIPLIEAMSQLLDDMRDGGQCVCLAAKAQARVAYEPFRHMVDDDGDGLMSLAEAEKIVKELNQ